MLAPALLLLLLNAAPVAPPDGGMLLLDPDGGTTVAVPGLEKFASSSDSIDVQQAGPDALLLRPRSPSGAQVDAWTHAGAHLQLRVFVRQRAPIPFAGLDFLPLTH